MAALGARVRGRVLGLVSRLKQQRMDARVRRGLARSRLVDAGWYRAAYGLAAGADAVRDCLAGPPERRPSPWFDAAWYLERYPDVRRSGLHPLVHYLLFGAQEGRDPNSHFSTRWYLDNNPDAAGALTPIDHYIEVGAARLADPSPQFDAAWYAANEMGEGAGGLDPLAHYLLVGKAAGARTQPFRPVRRGEPVELARLEAFKPFAGAPGRAPIALVAAAAPDGRISTASREVIEALAGEGVRVVAVVEASRRFSPDPGLLKLLAGGYVREARGRRFAAWAHMLRDEPLLFSGEMLLLVNGEAGLARPVEPALRRLKASAADVLAVRARAGAGATLDSDFVAFKGRALVAPAVHNFFGELRSDDRPLEEARADFEAALAVSVLEWSLVVENLPESPLRDSRKAGSAAGGAPETPAGTAKRLEGGLISPDFAAPASEPLKVALIGPSNYATGLSAATRGYISALWRAGVRLNVHPIERPFHVHRRVAPTVAARDFDGAADAVIVHLNPDAWDLLTPVQRAVIEHARVRIGLWVWEMGHVPASWSPVFESVDEIWTPSRYCAEVLAAQTRARVSVIPHVVTTPEPSAADRADVLRGLELDPQARIILYAFDAASFILRKNPQALIKAFALTGLADRGWRVVLKTKHLMDQPADGAALARLAAETPGVVLLEKDLDQEGLSALFEAADIYASPHRSEGFGLTVAEAMAMGKPVVASDYGGVRDFLDETCGFPVPVDVIENPQATEIYPKGGRWADVRVADFAAALAACAAQVEAGDDRIGRSARARIAERLSAGHVAELMKTALDEALSVAARRASAA